MEAGFLQGVLSQQTLQWCGCWAGKGSLCLLAVWNPSPVPAALLPAELDPLGEGNSGSPSCKLKLSVSISVYSWCVLLRAELLSLPDAFCKSESCSPPSSFHLRSGVESKSTSFFLEKVLSLNASSATTFCFGLEPCLSFHTQGRVIADRL